MHELSGILTLDMEECDWCEFVKSLPDFGKARKFKGKPYYVPGTFERQPLIRPGLWTGTGGGGGGVPEDPLPPLLPVRVVAAFFKLATPACTNSA